MVCGNLTKTVNPQNNMKNVIILPKNSLSNCLNIKIIYNHYIYGKQVSSICPHFVSRRIFFPDLGHLIPVTQTQETNLWEK